MHYNNIAVTNINKALFTILSENGQSPQVVNTKTSLDAKPA